MATPVTPPITPGKHTSEHRLTVVVLISGFVLQTFAGLLAALQAAGVGSGKLALPVTLAVISAVMQALPVFGYTRARAQVKMAQLVGIHVAKDMADGGGGS